jgi:hypothetical protein
MDNLIERYVYDVTRRLPEKEQEDVRKELTANIYDMLPIQAGEEAVKTVLLNLGPTYDLAEQYRQKPNYLISPATYSSLVNMGCIVYLVNRPDIFNPAVIAFMQNLEVKGSFDITRLLHTGEVSYVAIAITVIIIINTVAECGKAVYITVKNHKAA